MEPPEWLKLYAHPMVKPCQTIDVAPALWRPLGLRARRLPSRTETSIVVDGAGESGENRNDEHDEHGIWACYLFSSKKQFSYGRTWWFEEFRNWTRKNGDKHRPCKTWDWHPSSDLAEQFVELDLWCDVQPKPRTSDNANEPANPDIWQWFPPEFGKSDCTLPTSLHSLACASTLVSIL